jgi:DNA polymerase-3 subunit epsilon
MNVTGYQARFDDTWTEETPWEAVRFVALDSETTGLDPRRDRLITIGAIAVIGGDVLLEDCLELMCKLDYNRSSVTVHGITRDETRDALEEPEALARFLEYLGDGVIVGHHIGHDIQALNVAYERHAGLTLQNRWLDTMDLALRLNDAEAFGERPMAAGFSLDGLCDMFGIAAHDRHTAGGDAFITAQVFQRLLRAARRAGWLTLGALTAPYGPG